MKRILWALLTLAVLAAPIILGCEILRDKEIDQKKIDRLQDKIENGKEEDRYYQ